MLKNKLNDLNQRYVSLGEAFKTVPLKGPTSTMKDPDIKALIRQYRQQSNPDALQR